MLVLHKTYCAALNRTKNKYGWQVFTLENFGNASENNFTNYLVRPKRPQCLKMLIRMSFRFSKWNKNLLQMLRSGIWGRQKKQGLPAYGKEVRVRRGRLQDTNVFWPLGGPKKFRPVITEGMAQGHQTNLNLKRYQKKSDLGGSLPPRNTRGLREDGLLPFVTVRNCRGNNGACSWRAKWTVGKITTYEIFKTCWRSVFQNLFCELKCWFSTGSQWKEAKLGEYELSLESSH